MTGPRIVLVTGHMVDLPDRDEPRFPADQVPRVTVEVRAALEDWQVGPPTTVVCGGARGADLIVAEEAAARGARIVLCLALPVDQFVRTSVEVPGTDWAARFARIAGLAEVREPDGGGADGDAGSGDVFARANDRMVEAARAVDPRPHVIIVWDGRDGDGPGGTADVVRWLGPRLREPRVRVIDPTRCPGPRGGPATPPG